MNNWIINSNELKDNRDGFLQSIFTLGNGYMAVRGFDSFVDGKSYEYCTYIAGLFDYYEEPYTDMVNSPNYLKSKLYINDQVVLFNNTTIKSKQQSLNMKEGILYSEYLLEAGNGYQIKLEEKRFLSIADTHKVCIKYNITPINFSGEIGFETGIDYNISNSIIHDDQTKEDIGIYKFLDFVEVKKKNNNIAIKLKTKETDYDLIESFTCISEESSPIRISENQCEALRFNSLCHKGEIKTYFKYISVYTSRDIEVKKEENLMDLSLLSLEDSISLGYEALKEKHIKKWEEIWDVSNITINGDTELEKKLRFNIFQLILNNASNNPNVNIGARGLTHGRYKGCYFWDTEIFMLPFYL